MYFKIYEFDTQTSAVSEVSNLTKMEQILDKLNQNSAYKSKVEYGSDRFSQEYNVALESKVFKINNCTFQKEYSEFNLPQPNLMLIISLHLNALGIYLNPSN